MLNPSTANKDSDDPTIRRCVNLVAANGGDTLIVANLHSIVSVDPKRLLEPFCHATPIGTDDAWIVECVTAAHTVVVAWGAHKKYFFDRDKEVLELLKINGIQPWCLGITKEGFPRHPLYVSKTTSLEEYCYAD